MSSSSSPSQRFIGQPIRLVQSAYLYAWTVMLGVMSLGLYRMVPDLLRQEVCRPRCRS